LRLGAGAFVCGEETALLNSIQGQRGMPRPRPPFPAVKGLWDCPTIVNNVETLACVPYILREGFGEFAKYGTERSKGTKVFALAGKVNNVGLVEVPMGTTLRELIYDIGGGIPNGKKFKAIQTGGPSGGCLTAEVRRYEDGEFYEDMNVLFAREEPRYMNALWSRAENYDEYVEELPLYGDIEHKFGGRITVFITPTKFVIHYAIRGVAEGKCEAFSKADMLAVTKNLKCGIDFFMRHRDKVEEGFVTDLFKKPTVIPIIHDERHPRDEFEDEEEGFEEEEDFSEFEEDFDEFDEDFDENFDEE